MEREETEGRAVDCLVLGKDPFLPVIRIYKCKGILYCFRDPVLKGGSSFCN